VNFRSPLLWDVFAISTYFTISLVFWYVGYPRLAILRDRAKGRIKRTLSSLLPGLERLARTWSRYAIVSLLPGRPRRRWCVSSITIVSMTSHLGDPGLATHPLPPYFVAGAVFSGFGW